MARRSVPEALAAGLAALARMQFPDGSFPQFVRQRPGPAPWRRCSPLYSSAYVMLGAGRLLSAERKVAVARYLRDQCRPDGLWEFDPAYGVPADADGTACALAALARAGDAVDGAAGAARLRRFWRPVERQFRTWEGSPEWQDPARDDAIVNCNIIYALDLLGSPATESERTGVRTMLRRTEKSRYFLRPSTIAHTAVRAGFALEDVPPVAKARPDARSVLGTAHWLCATRRLEPELIDTLLVSQLPDGGWPIEAWFSGLGPHTPQWGSPAVTTALAIEALQNAQGA